MDVWPPLSASYSATDFPASVTRSGTLHFTADELAHALFTTGRAPGDRSKHGQASFWEWIHRTSLIPAYLQPVGARARLNRTNLAAELDRSEKVAVSYALGQAMTGVFSRRVLRVPFLMHLDRYAHAHDVRFVGGRSRPDLFGLMAPHPRTGKTRWVVAEAKGRSRAMEPGLRERLVAQKRMVATIGGRAPSLAYGCVTSFPTARGGLRIDAFDPEEPDEQAVDLDMNEDAFIQAYYEPFLTALEALGGSDQYGALTIAGNQGLGLRVGVLTRIIELVGQARNGTIDGLYREVLGALAPYQRSGDFPAPDGAVVHTPWSEAGQDAYPLGL